MLKTFRKSQKVILSFFIVVISMVFVFWGFYGGLNSLGKQEIASVNGERISIQEFQTKYQGMVRLYQNILKENFTPEMADRFNIKQLALNQLIDEKLMIQGAKSLGLKVSDEEIRKQIYELPYFKKDNQFNPETYRNILKANRLSVTQFEQGLRLEILQEKISGLLKNHLKVVPEEVFQEYLLKNDKVNIEFVKLDPTLFKSVALIDPLDFKKFSDKKENQNKAKNYYAENAHLFKQPLEIHAQHILIKFDAKNKASMRKKAEEILAKTRSEDFSTLAKKYSHDETTAKAGGDLGYFGQGKMVKPFENAALALKPGEISPVVESVFGYHIIKVNDIHPEKHRTLDEVKENILKTLYSDEKSALFTKETIEKIWTARSNLKQFEVLLKQYKLSWEETGTFTRGTKFIPKIGESEELMKTAFSLKNKGELPSRYFSLVDKFYIVRLKNRDSADLTKFEKDKASLTEQVLNQKRSAAFYEWIKELKEGSKISIRKNLFSPEEQS